MNTTPTQPVLEISDTSKLIERPLVSVAMLAYRHEKYLADAIEGVLFQQTNFPIELVIAEDHSPDRTLEIATRYQREHPHVIRVLTADVNVGMAQNFARVATACRGKYIAFCEGDDYWIDPNKLRMQIDILERNSDISLVHTAYDERLTFARRDRIYKRTPKKPGALITVVDDAYCKIQHQNLFIMTCTAVIRATILHSFYSTFNWRHFMVLDWPVFAFAGSKGKIARINVSTAVYRVVAGSAMHSGASADVARARNADVIYDELDRVCGKTDSTTWLREVAVAKACYAAALAAGEIDVFREAVRRLDRCHMPVGALSRMVDEACVRIRTAWRVRQLPKTIMRAIRVWVRYRLVSE